MKKLVENVEDIKSFSEKAATVVEQTEKVSTISDYDTIIIRQEQLPDGTWVKKTHIFPKDDVKYYKGPVYDNKNTNQNQTPSSTK